MKDKLREILDRIDERPDVGSIHEAKEEAISAILKLVEEKNCYCVCHSEYSSCAVCEHCENAVEVCAAKYKSQLAELKQVSDEMAKSLDDLLSYDSGSPVTIETQAEEALASYKKLRSK